MRDGDRKRVEEARRWARNSRRCNTDGYECEYCGLGYYDWAVAPSLWEMSRLDANCCVNCFPIAIIDHMQEEHASGGGVGPAPKRLCAKCGERRRHVNISGAAKYCDECIYVICGILPKQGECLEHEDGSTPAALAEAEALNHVEALMERALFGEEKADA